MDESLRHDQPTVAHETRDISVSGAVKIAVTVAVTVAIAIGICWAMAVWYIGGPLSQTSPNPVPTELPAEPRLEAWDPVEGKRFIQRDPSSRPREVRPRRDIATDPSVLDQYGWVDEKAKIARVPIDRAMRMYLDDAKANQKQGSTGSTGAEQPKTARRPAWGDPNPIISDANSGRTRERRQ